jgi:hypothetical protein
MSRQRLAEYRIAQDQSVAMKTILQPTSGSPTPLMPPSGPKARIHRETSVLPLHPNSGRYLKPVTRPRRAKNGYRARPNVISAARFGCAETFSASVALGRNPIVRVDCLGRSCALCAGRCLRL